MNYKNRLTVDDDNYGGEKKYKSAISLAGLPPYSAEGIKYVIKPKETTKGENILDKVEENITRGLQLIDIPECIFSFDDSSPSFSSLAHSTGTTFDSSSATSNSDSDRNNAMITAFDCSRQMALFGTGRGDLHFHRIVVCDTKSVFMNEKCDNITEETNLKGNSLIRIASKPLHPSINLDKSIIRYISVSSYRQKCAISVSMIDTVCKKLMKVDISTLYVAVVTQDNNLHILLIEGEEGCDIPLNASRPALKPQECEVTKKLVLNSNGIMDYTFNVKGSGCNTCSKGIVVTRLLVFSLSTIHVSPHISMQVVSSSSATSVYSASSIRANRKYPLIWIDSEDEDIYNNAQSKRVGSEKVEKEGREEDKGAPPTLAIGGCHGSVIAVCLPPLMHLPSQYEIIVDDSVSMRENHFHADGIIKRNAKDMNNRILALRPKTESDSLFNLLHFSEHVRVVLLKDAEDSPVIQLSYKFVTKMSNDNCDINNVNNIIAVDHNITDLGLLIVSTEARSTLVKGVSRKAIDARISKEQSGDTHPAILQIIDRFSLIEFSNNASIINKISFKKLSFNINRRNLGIRALCVPIQIGTKVRDEGIYGGCFGTVKDEEVTIGAVFNLASIVSRIEELNTAIRLITESGNGNKMINTVMNYDATRIANQLLEHNKEKDEPSLELFYNKLEHPRPPAMSRIYTARHNNRVSEADESAKVLRTYYLKHSMMDNDSKKVNVASLPSTIGFLSEIPNLSAIISKSSLSIREMMCDEKENKKCLENIYFKESNLSDNNSVKRVLQTPVVNSLYLWSEGHNYLSILSLKKIIGCESKWELILPSNEKDFTYLPDDIFTVITTSQFRYNLCRLALCTNKKLLVVPLSSVLFSPERESNEVFFPCKDEGNSINFAYNNSRNISTVVPCLPNDTFKSFVFISDSKGKNQAQPIDQENLSFDIKAINKEEKSEEFAVSNSERGNPPNDSFDKTIVQNIDVCNSIRNGEGFESNIMTAIDNLDELNSPHETIPLQLTTISSKITANRRSVKKKVRKIKKIVPRPASVFPSGLSTNANIVDEINEINTRNTQFNLNSEEQLNGNKKNKNKKNFIDRDLLSDEHILSYLEERLNPFECSSKMNSSHYASNAILSLKDNKSDLELSITNKVTQYYSDSQRIKVNKDNTFTEEGNKDISTSFIKENNSEEKLLLNINNMSEKYGVIVHNDNENKSSDNDISAVPSLIPSSLITQGEFSLPDDRKMDGKRTEIESNATFEITKAVETNCERRVSANYQEIGGNAEMTFFSINQEQWVSETVGQNAKSLIISIYKDYAASALLPQDRSYIFFGIIDKLLPLLENVIHLSFSSILLSAKKEMDKNKLSSLVLSDAFSKGVDLTVCDDYNDIINDRVISYCESIDAMLLMGIPIPENMEAHFVHDSEINIDNNINYTYSPLANIDSRMISETLQKLLYSALEWCFSINNMSQEERLRIFNNCKINNSCGQQGSRSSSYTKYLMSLYSKNYNIAHPLSSSRILYFIKLYRVIRLWYDISVENVLERITSNNVNLSIINYCNNFKHEISNNDKIKEENFSNVNHSDIFGTACSNQMFTNVLNTGLSSKLANHIKSKSCNDNKCQGSFENLDDNVKIDKKDVVIISKNTPLFSSVVNLFKLESKVFNLLTLWIASEGTLAMDIINAQIASFVDNSTDYLIYDRQRDKKRELPNNLKQDKKDNRNNSVILASIRWFLSPTEWIYEVHRISEMCLVVCQPLFKRFNLVAYDRSRNNLNNIVNNNNENVFDAHKENTQFYTPEAYIDGYTELRDEKLYLNTIFSKTLLPNNIVPSIKWIDRVVKRINKNDKDEDMKDEDHIGIGTLIESGSLLYELLITFRRRYPLLPAIALENSLLQLMRDKKNIQGTKSNVHNNFINMNDEIDSYNENNIMASTNNSFDSLTSVTSSKTNMSIVSTPTFAISDDSYSNVTIINNSLKMQEEKIELNPVNNLHLRFFFREWKEAQEGILKLAKDLVKKDFYVFKNLHVTKRFLFFLSIPSKIIMKRFYTLLKEEYSKFEKIMIPVDNNNYKNLNMDDRQTVMNNYSIIKMEIIHYLPFIMVMFPTKMLEIVLNSFPQISIGVFNISMEYIVYKATSDILKFLNNFFYKKHDNEFFYHNTKEGTQRQQAEKMEIENKNEFKNDSFFDLCGIEMSKQEFNDIRCKIVLSISYKKANVIFAGLKALFNNKEDKKNKKKDIDYLKEIPLSSTDYWVTTFGVISSEYYSSSTSLNAMLAGCISEARWSPLDVLNISLMHRDFLIKKVSSIKLKVNVIDEREISSKNENSKAKTNFSNKISSNIINYGKPAVKSSLFSSSSSYYTGFYNLLATPISIFYPKNVNEKNSIRDSVSQSETIKNERNVKEKDSLWQECIKLSRKINDIEEGIIDFLKLSSFKTKGNSFEIYQKLVNDKFYPEILTLCEKFDFYRCLITLDIVRKYIEHHIENNSIEKLLPFFQYCSDKIQNEIKQNMMEMRITDRIDNLDRKEQIKGYWMDLFQMAYNYGKFEQAGNMALSLYYKKPDLVKIILRNAFPFLDSKERNDPIIAAFLEKLKKLKESDL